MMKNIMIKIIVVMMNLGTCLLAQGVNFPSTPTQTPIGGLGVLALLGAALVYKSLKKK
tara:strand:+ start:393 stop:566 length:174 start_codon:yes stop_codon:yes gene_type:complete